MSTAHPPSQTSNARRVLHDDHRQDPPGPDRCPPLGHRLHCLLVPAHQEHHEDAHPPLPHPSRRMAPHPRIIVVLFYQVSRLSAAVPRSVQRQLTSRVQGTDAAL